MDRVDTEVVPKVAEDFVLVGQEPAEVDKRDARFAFDVPATEPHGDVMLCRDDRDADLPDPSGLEEVLRRVYQVCDSRAV